jgi:hypothetical protein
MNNVQSAYNELLQGCILAARVKSRSLKSRSHSFFPSKLPVEEIEYLDDMIEFSHHLPNHIRETEYGMGNIWFLNRVAYDFLEKYKSDTMLGVVLLRSIRLLVSEVPEQLKKDLRPELLELVEE